MVEAFHDRPTLLVGRPLICHRTQTQEEKRAALGAKASEADFMSDAQLRNAKYFSHPLAAMLDELVSREALTPADILQIPEKVFREPTLVDFLIACISLNRAMEVPTTVEAWERTTRFFRSLPLDDERRRSVEALLAPSGRLCVWIASDLRCGSGAFRSSNHFRHFAQLQSG